MYLTAGAAGMYCGSCLHDNAIAKALIAAGHDTLLVPTYTPIQTDEASVASNQLFYGGLNVYLQQVFPLARYLPTWADRFLSSPRLVGWIASRAMGTTADKLGGLTVSMLRGTDGNQRKEVKHLVNWLEKDIQPEVIVFSNLLIGGAIGEIRKRLKNTSVVVVLQGDDAFFDQLTEPYATQSMKLLQDLAQQVDLFIVHSRAYGQRMQERLHLRPDQWKVIPLSLDTKDFIDLSRQPQEPATPKIGYLARLAPEKGLHVLADAFCELAKRHPTVRLEIAGWLGKQHQTYWDKIQSQFAQHNLTERVHYWGSVNREDKLRFLSSIDVLSVPATHFEPKGLFVLEALAAGVPVILPDHAAFPELIERLGGGWLFKAEDSHALAEALGNMLGDLVQARVMGSIAREKVLADAHTTVEAQQLIEHFQQLRTGR